MKLAPHWQILISLALAVLLGLFIKTMGLQDTTFFSWVIEISGLVGKLFMNLLKMIIVPLVVSSVIAGIAIEAMRSARLDPIFLQNAHDPLSRHRVSLELIKRIRGGNANFHKGFMRERLRNRLCHP
ncbi:dicarboxylate/amino acid:cation symporter [Akkermansiaceae bacterium]|nr:dicarboxylate/amino acid:cation symporter [Akkermansiaceae bacterium]